MVRAKKGDTVRVNYTGKLEDGTVFDTTADRYPMEVLLDGKQVIPGFEKAIIGMKPGESKTVKIPMKEAYGPRYDKLIGKMDRDRLPSDMKIEVGQRLQFNVPGSEGEVMAATVTEISDKKITLDGNQPLAGKDLVFFIELVEIM